MNKENKPKKGKGKTLALIGLGVVALGGIGVLVWKYLQGKEQKNNTQSLTNALSPSSERKLPPPSSISTPSIPSSIPRPSNGGSSSARMGFPLRRGSKGDAVIQLQTALNQRYGARLRTDGDFGRKTEAAIIKAGLPKVIDSVQFSKITGKPTAASIATAASSASASSGSSGTQKLTPSKVASFLKVAMLKNDLNMALKALSLMKNTGHYTAANNVFKQKAPIGHFTRKTIVSAMLGQFTDSGDKKQLANAFKKIGLKQNGSKWSLSGLGSLGQLVAAQPTKVWNDDGITIGVPTGTVLGMLIQGANGITEFETLDHKRLFVKTDHIKYTTI